MENDFEEKSEESKMSNPDPRPLPPPDLYDPVIEVSMKDVDRSLLRENLKLTPQQRGEKFERMMEMVFELRRQAALRREKDFEAIAELRALLGDRGGREPPGS